MYILNIGTSRSKSYAEYTIPVTDMANKLSDIPLRSLMIKRCLQIYSVSRRIYQWIFIGQLRIHRCTGISPQSTKVT